MRIRDDKLDAAQTAPGEFAQECRPERLRLRWTDIHTQDLAPAIAVDADYHAHCHPHHQPALDLQLHQAVGGKADHLPQQIGVRIFSKSARRFIISSVIGGSSNQVGCDNPTLLGESSMTDRSRSLATAL